MENLLIAINAVVPFVIYMMYGYLMKRFKVADDSFFIKLNTVCFKAFFPIMMFKNLYFMDMHSGLDPSVMMTGFIMLLIVIIACCLIVPLFIKNNRQIPVVIQAIFRGNTLLFAIPLTESIFGAEGAAVATLIVATAVPLYNVAAVTILEYYNGGKPSFSALILKLLKNPLIIGSIVGAIFLFGGIKLPECVEVPVTKISNLTSPLAIFVLGASIRFSDIRKNLKVISISMFVKLVFIPILVVIYCACVGLGKIETFSLFSMFAAPVAAGSFPMAQNMGADGEMAAQFVCVSTIVSVLTLFVWIVVLKSLGLV